MEGKVFTKYGRVVWWHIETLNSKKPGFKTTTYRIVLDREGDPKVDYALSKPVATRRLKAMIAERGLLTQQELDRLRGVGEAKPAKPQPQLSLFPE